MYNPSIQEEDQGVKANLTYIARPYIQKQSKNDAFFKIRNLVLNSLYVYLFCLPVCYENVGRANITLLFLSFAITTLSQN